MGRRAGTKGTALRARARPRPRPKAVPICVTAARAGELPEDIVMSVESAREFDDPFESTLEVSLPVPAPDDEHGPTVGRLVAAGAFEGNEHITTLIVPEGVEGIGHRAFAECPNLEEVVLPISLVWTAGAVFEGCPKLKRVVGPTLAVLGRSNFHRSPIATLFATATVTALTGDQFVLEELPLLLCEYERACVTCARERKSGGQTPPDLNNLLAKQHPGTDLDDPTQFYLMAPVIGSSGDEMVPLSLNRGAESLAGLRRLEQGELDLHQIVAVFIDPEEATLRSPPPPPPMCSYCRSAHHLKPAT